MNQANIVAQLIGRVALTCTSTAPQRDNSAVRRIAYELRELLRRTTPSVSVAGSGLWGMRRSERPPAFHLEGSFPSTDAVLPLLLLLLQQPEARGESYVTETAVWLWRFQLLTTPTDKMCVCHRELQEFASSLYKQTNSIGKNVPLFFLFSPSETLSVFTCPDCQACDLHRIGLWLNLMS